jgi:hypothetical protein
LLNGRRTDQVIESQSNHQIVESAELRLCDHLPHKKRTSDITDIGSCLMFDVRYLAFDANRTSKSDIPRMYFSRMRIHNFSPHKVQGPNAIAENLG